MESQIALVKSLITQGEAFTFQNFCFPNPMGRDLYGGEPTPDWTAWLARVNNIVSRYFADTSPAQKILVQGLRIGTEGNGKENFEQQRTLLLKALEMSIGVMENDAFGELRETSSKSRNPAHSNRIFIVHGHDHALKTDVEGLMHQLGLEPVVLHRQADMGRTVIEKFEEHSDVGFAFILLTPDDIAYAAGQDAAPDAERAKEARARQNVIFEFGYFVGRLGRDRVCCLYKRGVAIPTDIAGFVYKEIDGSIEAQGYAIIKELKAAGYALKI